MLAAKALLSYCLSTVARVTYPGFQSNSHTKLRHRVSDVWFLERAHLLARDKASPQLEEAGLDVLKSLWEKFACDERRPAYVPILACTRTTAMRDVQSCKFRLTSLTLLNESCSK